MSALGPLTGQAEQPRRWRCGQPSDTYCAVHGDCTCPRHPNRERCGLDRRCPLHAAVSEHPQGSVFLEPRRVA